MELQRNLIGSAVLALAVYPEKGAPGRSLRSATVETEGLQGDRRKKRPVHVVGREHGPDVARANVFLDAADEDLQRLVGERLRLGRVVLTVVEIPKNCPGVYAEVVRPGLVSVGDTIC